MLEHLKEQLIAAGITLEPRSEQEVYQKIVSTEENKYILKLVRLLCTFIQNFKTNGYDTDKFREMHRLTDNVRTKLFLDVCHQCYLEYSKKLKERGAVDFEDMINDSAKILQVTSTGLGCVESTEKFLSAMVREGEEYLQPTHFMQSTHNTISSQIAVKLGCHGYNNTHVNDGVTFESALLDATMNFELGKLRSALVTANDELTPAYFELLGQIGYWKREPHTQQTLLEAQSEGSFAGEVSAAFVLEDTPKPHTLCALRAVELLHAPTEQRLQRSVERILTDNNLTLSDISAVMIGKSGDCSNDAVYNHLCPSLFGQTPLIWYKHIFGESYTASGLGMYAAVVCLSRGRIPAHLTLDGKAIEQPRNILMYNHFKNREHSLVLLSLC